MLWNAHFTDGLSCELYFICVICFIYTSGQAENNNASFILQLKNQQLLGNTEKLKGHSNKLHTIQLNHIQYV